VQEDGPDRSLIRCAAIGETAASKAWQIFRIE
jgi:hypothetical protein